MAQINELIPFILYFEAGVPKKYLSLPLSQLFDKAKLTGFANDPDDRGGATMCGITIATFESYCRKKGYPKPTVERLKAITLTNGAKSSKRFSGINGKPIKSTIRLLQTSLWIGCGHQAQMA